jgi:hypothetical protein
LSIVSWTLLSCHKTVVFKSLLDISISSEFILLIYVDPLVMPSFPDCS